MAQNLPSASKDILPMYNNRSAMYERAGKLEEALNDITVVLAVDVKHMKGRARRARILEAQGKLYDAIDELVLLMSLEQLEVIVNSHSPLVSCPFVFSYSHCL